MLLFIHLFHQICQSFTSFNTSHVTLYLQAILGARGVCGFNTSHVTLYLNPDYQRDYVWSFNTSHVTLYLLKYLFHLIIFIRFNTSHVTLYLKGFFTLL